MKPKEIIYGVNTPYPTRDPISDEAALEILKAEYGVDDCGVCKPSAVLSAKRTADEQRAYRASRRKQ